LAGSSFWIILMIRFFELCKLWSCLDRKFIRQYKKSAACDHEDERIDLMVPVIAFFVHPGRKFLDFRSRILVGLVIQMELLTALKTNYQLMSIFFLEWFTIFYSHMYL
jgi:hypothetical protein